MSRRRVVPVLLGVAVALMAAGCGRRQAGHQPGTPLTLRELDALRDTSGLSRGGPIVERFEPYRLANGLIRVRGELALPAGTVLQVAVYRPGERWPVTRTQFSTLGDGRFDSPPMLGAHGPLPPGDYRFELLGYFDAEWQPPAVLRATGDGRELRGPGITRDREGRAALSHAEVRHL